MSALWKMRWSFVGFILGGALGILAIHPRWPHVPYVGTILGSLPVCQAGMKLLPGEKCVGPHGEPWIYCFSDNLWWCEITKDEIDRADWN